MTEKTPLIHGVFSVILDPTAIEIAECTKTQFLTMSLLEQIHNRYNLENFINHPVFSGDIEIVYNKDTGICPFFSVITPVHNQNNIIVNNVRSTLNCMTEKYFELILIIDACSDNTELVLSDFFLDYSWSPLLTRVLILKSSIPLFETCSDNLGFFCSRGEYCLEIQADMEMVESGFNMKLLYPFLIRDDIIGISGRCCYNFTTEDGVGKIGLDANKKLSQLNIDTGYYYIYKTCNRGPLLLHREKIKQLGYLDEVHYFLDNSEHDLFARAAVQKGWKCGYLPMDFNSPLENGSTRKPRDELNQYYYNQKKKTCKEENGFLSKHKVEIEKNSKEMKTDRVQKYKIV